MNSYQVCSAKDCINLASTGDDTSPLWKSCFNADLSAPKGADTAQGAFWSGNSGRQVTENTSRDPTYTETRRKKRGTKARAEQRGR